jgi:adenylosuccinate lyase
MRDELNGHWEVLAEAVQTMLRKDGKKDAYEELKMLTRGEKIDETYMADFIKKLKLSINDKENLLRLKPESYIGEASKIVEQL